MKTISHILIVLIVVQHVGFMVFEMFFWAKPAGLKAFRMTQETANTSAFLARNQGLYNGFLAAGLIWSLVHPDPAQAFSLKIFFLFCILVAGIYGGLTTLRTILWMQALPAAVGIVLIWI